MDVHLIDGTYELFRHFFAVPSTADSNGQEIGAVRGVLTSVLSKQQKGDTSPINTPCQFVLLNKTKRPASEEIPKAFIEVNCQIRPLYGAQMGVLDCFARWNLALLLPLESTLTANVPTPFSPWSGRWRS
jgi:hypothetical protein